MREVERELAECRGILTALAERLSDQALTPEDRAYAAEVDGLLASASADIDDPMVWCKRLAKEIEYARFATRSGLHSYTLARTSMPGTTMISNSLYRHDDGALVVASPEVEYKSDAVAETKRVSHRITRDGIHWDDYTGCEEALTHAVRLHDGTLLETGSCGWQNFTEADRERLEAEGLYIFDRAQGNAEGVYSVIYQVWMRSSRDGGETWEPRTAVELPRPVCHLAVYGRPIVLKDGTYLAPMWGRYSLREDPRYVSAMALRTTDGGETWDLLRVAHGIDMDFNEHEMAQAPNGDVVSVMRTTSQARLWESISRDSGRTWSEPQPTSMRGSTPALVVTKDGLLVCLYSRRAGNPGSGSFKETGMYAGISRDNGKSWSSYLLWNGHGSFVDGYPQAAALPDGRLVAAFSFPIDGRLASCATSFNPGWLLERETERE